MPPLRTNDHSRLIFFDLADFSASIETAEALVNHTGWIALTAEVLDSVNHFPDSALLEGAWLGTTDFRETVEFTDDDSDEDQTSEIITEQVKGYGREGIKFNLARVDSTT